MVDLEKSKPIPTGCKRFVACQKHCFRVFPKDFFESNTLDFCSIVRDLAVFIPINKSCLVKLIDNQILIFEFVGNVRMKIDEAERGDCTIKRISVRDIYAFVNVFDHVDKTKSK